MEKITNIHRKMISELVLAGCSAKEVAEINGISYQTLSNMRRNPLWKTEEAELVDDIKRDYKARLSSLVPQAIDKISSIMHDCPDDRTSLNAAKEILSRSGLADDSNGPQVISISMVAPAWMESPDETITIKTQK